MKIGDTDELKFRVKYPDEKKRIANSIGMKFALISSGTFMMGSPEDEPERDGDERQHLVTISRPYYLQITEVTQGQWKAIMDDNPLHFKGDSRSVKRVSWNDCQEFTRKLIRQDMLQTRKGRHQDRTVSFAAVPGTLTRGA